MRHHRREHAGGGDGAAHAAAFADFLVDFIDSAAHRQVGYHAGGGIQGRKQRYAAAGKDGQSAGQVGGVDGTDQGADQRKAQQEQLLTATKGFAAKGLAEEARGDNQRRLKMQAVADLRRRCAFSR